MANTKLPFYRKKIKCPVCGSFTENFVFKAKVVIPRELDSDNYVLAYQWIDKSYKEFPPSFYAVWVCTSCGYADFPEYFHAFLKRRPYEFTILKKNILKDTKNKKSLIHELLRHISLDTDEIGFETAMTSHLLAVYCHDKLYPENNDYEKLGRLYLRIAWLFRDFRRLGLKNRTYDGHRTYWEYLKSLRKIWPDIPVDEESNIRKAAHYFSRIVLQDFSYEQAVKNIRLIFISAELYLRLNDFKAAYDIVHAVVRLGFEMRRNIKESIQLKRRNRELTRQDESYLLSRTNKISRELGDIHEKYREIKDKWVAFYAPQIEHIMKENERSASDVLITKLEEGGIPSEIIYILRTTDQRFYNEEKEKPHFWEFWK